MKKLILMIICSLLLIGQVEAKERAWRYDKEFIGFLGIEYRPCVEKLLNKYPKIYLCHERSAHYEIFGKEFGVCVKQVMPINTGPFWDEYDECKKQLNSKGIYDKYDMDEKKRKEAK